MLTFSLLMVGMMIAIIVCVYTILAKYDPSWTKDITKFAAKVRAKVRALRAKE